MATTQSGWPGHRSSRLRLHTALPDADGDVVLPASPRRWHLVQLLAESLADANRGRKPGAARESRRRS